jgi:hypothetical protein
MIRRQSKPAAIIANQIAEDAPTSEGRHAAVLDSGRKEVIKVSINANSRENRDGSEQTGGRQRAQGSGQEADPAQDQVDGRLVMNFRSVNRLSSEVSGQ